MVTKANPLPEAQSATHPTTSTQGAPSASRKVSIVRGKLDCRSMRFFYFAGMAVRNAEFCPFREWLEKLPYIFLSSQFPLDLFTDLSGQIPD